MQYQTTLAESSMICDARTLPPAEAEPKLSRSKSAPERHSTLMHGATNQVVQVHGGHGPVPHRYDPEFTQSAAARRTSLMHITYKSVPSNDQALHSVHLKETQHGSCSSTGVAGREKRGMRCARERIDVRREEVCGVTVVVWHQCVYVPRFLRLVESCCVSGVLGMNAASDARSR